MPRWTGILLALPSARQDGMVSRLPVYLHPIAGRPLAWHAAASLIQSTAPPERLVVITEGDLTDDLFQDLEVEVEVVVVPDAAERPRAVVYPLREDEERGVVLHAGAVIPAGAVERLLSELPGAWIPGDADLGAVVRSDPDHLARLLRIPDPLEIPNGALSADGRLDGFDPVPLVQDRASFAALVAQIRQRIVANLMAGGVSFLLPETVLVDVDVRIGRDSIIYPGTVLEGATTIGEETVIGPSCRIIDSWVGSGVELRGWNYISHTSIRNRAILEPYVRRGFD